MDIDDRRSLIGIRVQMLCDLFGKKLTEDGASAVRRVFGDALDRFDDKTIARAFSKAERTLPRFPTPKLMAELCREEQPTSDHYRYTKAKYEEPETRRVVDIWIDSVTGEKLFRAEDCAEGREFLVALRKVARR